METKDSTRDRILAAATIRYSHDGPESDVEKIAEAAGVDSAVLHQHFPEKHDLVEAVVLQSIAAAEQVIQEATDAEDPLEALQLILERFVPQRARNIGLLQVPGIRVLETPGVIDRQQRILAGWNAVFSRGQAAGKIRSDVQFSDLMVLVEALARVGTSDQWPGSIRILLYGVTAHT